MEKHFVTFHSPGTFVAEQTTKEIGAWDVDRAVEMSADISERHGAKPYAFQFTTRTRGPDDFDSVESARSGTFYLGGRVETLAEVEARDDPDERILRSNMRCNGWAKIVTTHTPWKNSRPLFEGDTVLPTPTE